MNKLEQKFEKFLWQSRFLVLVAVIASLLGAFVLFLVGTIDIVEVAVSAARYYMGQGTVAIHDFIVTDIIVAIDIYLIAVVLLIFGLGIYRLFISSIDESESHGDSHPFNVKSFDELKDKIVRVVILAVIIEFFRAVVDIRFSTPLDAIYLALSVLALAVSLFLMSWHSSRSGK
ncbi:YqhA family protein [Marinobacter nanhaiticus D15-8W]|uniref:YqhA family protein n=1 Tax=Marinobacter nanhaiticus D15-8W TaxID=626887 RepID=N6WVR4_9GAMM|nr:YqhA family protein [Marinobacter nanhaiticus]ENO12938.1 YqhA family protein [Marinobacter nanhaiticus D15-8W]BES70290.1 YqhA family protein [Marinobacter nanhaiticus D15-8W]